MGDSFSLTIPGRRFRDGPGIQKQDRRPDLDSGFARAARPGMTRW